MVNQDDGDSPKSVWKRLRLSWLRDEPDVAIALLVAIAVGVVDIMPGLDDALKMQLAVNGILVVLALLAVALIRNRAKGEPVQTELQRLLTSSSATLEKLPHRFDEVTELLDRTRASLDQSAVVSVIAGSEVRAELEAARRGTTSWVFKGGTGTYIRAVTLPECVETARRARRQLQVQLEILDPENPRVCEAYARFRRSLPSHREDVWSADRTRREAYATILAACWYRRHYDFLTIRVGLSATMSTCRWDMSASRVVVTREDPTAPALVAAHDKLYYAWCEAELNNSFAQSRQIPVERVLGVPLDDEPAVDEVRGLFSALGIPLDAFDDTEVVDITRRALRPPDPYQ